MITNARAQSAKLTFWNSLRTERNVKYAELAELFDLSHTTICKWFTGDAIPKKEHIESLCDFFEVDYETGVNAFVEAYNNRHAATPVLIDPVVVDDSEVESMCNEVTDKDEACGDTPVTQKTPTDVPKSLLLELVYGKIPYDTFFKFITLVVDGTGNPLEEIYGQVTFEEYETIRSILIDDDYPDSTEPIEYPDEIPVFDKWGNVIGMKKREEN